MWRRVPRPRGKAWLWPLGFALLVALGVAGVSLQQQRAATEAVAREVRAAQGSAGIDASLARTPPLGFNGWNTFHCTVDEQLVEGTARALVSRGLRTAGYRYVNLDDCWSAPTRTAAGRLQADPVRFPHGIAALARYVHGLGLKFGIYTDVGPTTCAGYPGSYEHEQRDAATFASWGVDYVKEDACALPSGDFPGYSSGQIAELLFARMAVALHATHRPIIFSLANAGDAALPLPAWGYRLAALWRSTADILPTWRSLLANFDGALRTTSTSGPGHWDDPDMLEVGNGLSPAQDRAQVSLWSMLSAPLLIGGDVRTMPRAVLRTLTNRAVLAVDQDARGAPPVAVLRSGNLEVLVKPLTAGRHAVLLLNRGAPGAWIDFSPARAGLPVGGASTARDLWTGRGVALRRRIHVFLPARSAVLWRVDRRTTLS